MQFLKNNRTTLGALCIVVLLIYIYFAYFRSPSGELLTSSITTSQDSSALLVTLANLHTLQLDNSIFSDPVFLSLTDFGVQIAPQNVGRRNPFAPLGSN